MADLLEQMNLSIRRFHAHAPRRLHKVLDLQAQGYFPVVSKRFYFSKIVNNEPQLFEN